MTKEQEEKRKPLGCLTVVLIVITTASYVLSSGPTMRASLQGRLSENCWETIYHPLILVAQRSEWAGDGWACYLDWWIKDLANR